MHDLPRTLGIPPMSAMLRCGPIACHGVLQGYCSMSQCMAVQKKLEKRATRARGRKRSRERPGRLVPRIYCRSTVNHSSEAEAWHVYVQVKFKTS